MCGFRFSGADIESHIHQADEAEQNGQPPPPRKIGLVMCYPNMREILMEMIPEKYDSLKCDYSGILAKYDLPHDLLPTISIDNLSSKIELTSGKRTILIVVFRYEAHICL